MDSKAFNAMCDEIEEETRQKFESGELKRGKHVIVDEMSDKTRAYLDRLASDESFKKSEINRLVEKAKEIFGD
jgi:hypothetical protein